MNDKSKMIDFISHQLNYGCERLVLAQGYTRRDDIVADVMVCGDELVLESNCPKEESDWITVREIYSHLRWRAMPVWEQKEWLRAVSRPAPATPEAQLDAFGDSLAEKIASRLQKNDGRLRPAHIEETNLARFRFQRVGSIWHIHFPVAGETKKAEILDSTRWQQMAYLLRNQDRWVPSETLAEHDDLETLGLIAADNNRRAERRYGSLTIDTLESTLNDKQARVKSARMRGDVEAAQKAENDLDDFTTKFGDTHKDFWRLLNQKEDNDSLAKSFHESVRKNRRRLLLAMRQPPYMMQECADYLEMTVRSEGYGFAYRPPSPAPDWIL
jgi:hypothetical protein